MSVATIIQIIACVATIISVILTVRNSQSKTLYRIEELEKKVDKHNTIIERTYKLEEHVVHIDEDLNKLSALVDNIALNAKL